MDVALQKMQSHGEKQVKAAKEAKKAKIVNEAVQALINHIQDSDSKISPMSIITIMGKIFPNWNGAMKNKRTIEGLTNAVTDELTNHKVAINKVIERVVPNLEFLKSEAEELKFLFSDAQSLVNQEPESFQAIVKLRISDHEKAEAERLENERIQIQKEADAKAKREADAKIELERKEIREEERKKAKAEEKKRREHEDTVAKSNPSQNIVEETPLHANANMVITDKAVHVTTQEPVSAMPRADNKKPAHGLPFNLVSEIENFIGSRLADDQAMQIARLLSSYK